MTGTVLGSVHELMCFLILTWNKISERVGIKTNLEIYGSYKVIKRKLKTNRSTEMRHRAGARGHH